MSLLRGKARGLRRRDALHTWTTGFAPNMTPMVDVVMVILVFFMVSAAFVGPEWFLRTVLPAPPGTGRTGTPDTAKATVRIDITLAVKDGATVASGQGLSEAGLEAMIAAVERAARQAGDNVQETVEVVLRPSGQVPYRDLIRMHEACQQAGIERVTVAVRKAGG